MFAIETTGRFTKAKFVFFRRYATELEASRVLRRIRSANTSNSIRVIEVKP